MAKKKAFTPLLYLASIVFLPWWISLSFNKSLKSWITNWWDTRQSETFLNDIQEKSILEQFIEVEELFLLDEMIKEYPETHLQKLRKARQWIDLFDKLTNGFLDDGGCWLRIKIVVTPKNIGVKRSRVLNLVARC
ncbi:hypothetical protein ES288_A01G234100v1 [Gossypium darwinii]|uniref:Uncharacterized protein n=1 Tax=Gossypium darwinii TaxID=34276 RepID=A0A5D2HQ30_GOSDA|nr:hypothetical protein ES288_A01G234100v1 [Gossypium darwinii]